MDNNRYSKDKSMEVEKKGAKEMFEEMTKEEMMEIDGGGIGKILKDFWQGVCDGVRESFEDDWPI